ncbi:MAG: hypothetical protein KDD66_04800 [Bdellovibrionales bacterium]|nr:hypothetical protein [Bdellovibrionales bacterium]
MSDLKTQLIALLRSGDPEVMEALSDGIHEFAEQEPETAYRLFGGIHRIDSAHNRYRMHVMETAGCPHEARRQRAHASMIE